MKRKERGKEIEWWYITIPSAQVGAFREFFEAYKGKPVSVIIKPVEAGRNG